MFRFIKSVLDVNAVNRAIKKHSKWITNRHVNNKIGKRLNISNHKKTLFNHLNITGDDLSYAIFTNSEIYNTDFIDCKLNNIDFSNSTLQKLVFQNCKIYNTDFTNVNMCNIYFINCTFDTCTFEEAQIETVNFDECLILECDFTRSNMVMVVFEETDLTDSIILPVNMEFVIGNTKQIKSMQLCGYNIAFTKDLLQIGCTLLPIDKWKTLTKNDIKRMVPDDMESFIDNEWDVLSKLLFDIIETTNNWSEKY